MLSNALLLAQVLVERYTRPLWQTAVIIVCVTIYLVALAVIFTWIGAELPAGES